MMTNLGRVDVRKISRTSPGTKDWREPVTALSSCFRFTQPPGEKKERSILPSFHAGEERNQRFYPTSIRVLLGRVDF